MSNNNSVALVRKIGNEEYHVDNIDGHPYAKVNQRVEAAHNSGGYSVESCEYKKILDVEVCEVWIVLPSGQRFPGTAEINRGTQKFLAKAQTRAIGRALAFAGFNIQTAIASEEEMEDLQTRVVESRPALAGPQPPDGMSWQGWTVVLAKLAGIETRDTYLKHVSEVTGKPSSSKCTNDEWQKVAYHLYPLAYPEAENEQGIVE